MTRNLDKKLRLLIKSAYDLPESKHKKDFLKNLEVPKIGLFDFFMAQLRYIRKRVWIIEGLIMLIYFIILLNINDSSFDMVTISMISSISPFLVLITSTEILRSISYNMAELEMATKYSLNKVILARTAILVSVNFIWLIFILAFFSFKAEYSVFVLGLYLFVPFLLTSVGSLYAANYIKNKSVNYCCAGVSAFVSLGNMLISNVRSDVYLGFWILTFVVLAILAIIEAKKFIKSMEEYNWNLI